MKLCIDVAHVCPCATLLVLCEIVCFGAAAVSWSPVCSHARYIPLVLMSLQLARRKEVEAKIDKTLREERERMQAEKERRIAERRQAQEQRLREQDERKRAAIERRRKQAEKKMVTTAVRIKRPEMC